MGALHIFSDDEDDRIERMLTVFARGIKREGLQIQASIQSNPYKLKTLPKVQYKPSPGGDTGVMVRHSRA